MRKIFAVTGATNKKSGRYFTSVLYDHANEANAFFESDICANVRMESYASCFFGFKTYYARRIVTRNQRV